MRIRNFKKKIAAVGIVLLLTGVLISTVGFVMIDFNVDAFREEDGHKWYRAIYMDEEGAIYFGIAPQ